MVYIVYSLVVKKSEFSYPFVNVWAITQEINLIVHVTSLSSHTQTVRSCQQYFLYRTSVFQITADSVQTQF